MLDIKEEESDEDLFSRTAEALEDLVLLLLLWSRPNCCLSCPTSSDFSADVRDTSELLLAAISWDSRALLIAFSVKQPLCKISLVTWFKKSTFFGSSLMLSRKLVRQRPVVPPPIWPSCLLETGGGENLGRWLGEGWPKLFADENCFLNDGFWQTGGGGPRENCLCPPPGVKEVHELAIFGHCLLAWSIGK